MKMYARVTMSYWESGGVLNARQSIRLLKRPSDAEYTFIDCVHDIDAEEVFCMFTNLGANEAGVFEVRVGNEVRDWEMGHVEEFDYLVRRLTKDELKELGLYP